MHFQESNPYRVSREEDEIKKVGNRNQSKIYRYVVNNYLTSDV